MAKDSLRLAGFEKFDEVKGHWIEDISKLSQNKKTKRWKVGITINTHWRGKEPGVQFYYTGESERRVKAIRSYFTYKKKISDFVKNRKELQKIDKLTYFKHRNMIEEKCMKLYSRLRAAEYVLKTTESLGKELFWKYINELEQDEI